MVSHLEILKKEKCFVLIKIVGNDFSGAIAGNPFGIDRVELAKNLNFSGASYNSIDSTSSRDFVCKLISF